MIPLAQGHNTSFFSARKLHTGGQTHSGLLRRHEALIVTLTGCHRRATEAYKNSMVLLFTREVYLTSLTTGQSFRKQCCGLRRNSFQWACSPPGKIWSTSSLLNVIQRSPWTQKNKAWIHLFDTLVPASCSRGSSAASQSQSLITLDLSNLERTFPIILHYTDPARYLISTASLQSCMHLSYEGAARQIC